MKKFLSIIYIIFALSFCLVGCSNENNNSQNLEDENTNNNFTASRVATSDENNLENNVKTTEPEIVKEPEPEPKPETDIASFSTKIYTPNDEARQNNIGITCSKLNGTIVKSRRNLFLL